MLLAVELYATVVGTLEGDARSFDFTPTDDALNHFGANEPGRGKSSLSGCQTPQAIIDETLDQLARANSDEVALPGSYPELQSSIQLFIRNLSQGAPVGAVR